MGQPCTADEGCAAGESCASEQNGWWGGYCSKPCDGGDCPDGSHCARIFEDGSRACVRDCSGASSCRDGYGCEDLDADGSEECLPVR